MNTKDKCLALAVFAFLVTVLCPGFSSSTTLASDNRAGDPVTEETRGQRPPPSPGLASGSVEFRRGLRSLEEMEIELARPAPGSLLESTRDRSRQSISDTSGPVQLDVDKSWNGGEWELLLSWSGQTSPTTVSYSTDPSFQERVETLEKGYGVATLTITENDAADLECFDVTDDTTSSRAVQGLGYDPHPRPRVTGVVEPATLSPGDKWWLDEVVVEGGYFDPIARANWMGMPSQPVRAHEVEGVSGDYAARAKFFVPRDGRAFWIAPRSRGRATEKIEIFQDLVPKGLGPYANIRAAS